MKDTGPVELIVIRHGETEWNADKRMQGHIDVPLNAVGKEQAVAISRRLQSEHVRSVYSSDLLRARQTAEEIALHHALPVKLDVRLREIHMGIFQGLTREQAILEHQEYHDRFFYHDPEFAIPGGQSRHFKQMEMSGFIDELVEIHSCEKVVVVTHGGVLIAMMRHIMKLPISMSFRVKLFNAGIQRFRYENGHWMLVSWGDISHLQGLTMTDEL